MIKTWLNTVCWFIYSQSVYIGEHDLANRCIYSLTIILILFSLFYKIVQFQFTRMVGKYHKWTKKDEIMLYFLTLNKKPNFIQLHREYFQHIPYSSIKNKYYSDFFQRQDCYRVGSNNKYQRIQLQQAQHIKHLINTLPAYIVGSNSLSNSSYSESEVPLDNSQIQLLETVKQLLETI